jgi:hypothetical protein
MRLWSINPKYLDPKGLVALWREALLAQKVLLGQTKGYVHHPQLDRFRKHPSPIAAIGFYLFAIWQEAENRGYKFNRDKILTQEPTSSINVTEGQLNFELAWLYKKVEKRDQRWLPELERIDEVLPHPLFVAVPGKIELWEKSRLT